jgi:outer membrane murein-binding lipoprotein Lpp
MSVKRAVVTAYMLGRAGCSLDGEMIDRLVNGLSDADVMQLGRKVGALEREVAALRREVEASRPHKVVAMRLKDGEH